MSEQPAEGTAAAGPDIVELPKDDNAAFSALMDALAPEGDEGKDPAGEGAAPAGGAGGAAAPAAGDPAGKPGAGTGGTGGSGGTTGSTGTVAEPGTGGGDSGSGAGGTARDATPGAPGGTDAAAGRGDPGSGGTGTPDDWTLDAVEVAPKFGALSTAFEESVSKEYLNDAVDEMQKEEGYKPYFEALNQHPRAMVGKSVPRLDGEEGNETLKDTQDARDWQDALREILGKDARARAVQEMDDNSEFLTTVHSSIELFQNNTDLIPYTKGFDRELADRFTTLAEPYELRTDGKLNGYSIPVQPIIDNIRNALVKERADKPAAPSTPAASEGKAAGASSTPAPAADPPQAGIASKAGSSDNKEDFSTLFGTIGLPDLQI